MLNALQNAIINNLFTEKDKENNLSQKFQKANEFPKGFVANKCDPPALELDVYIAEDHMEKIVVYKEDWPELVADEFCLKFGLPDSKKELLLNVIRDQVSKVLTCISEEEYDTDALF